MREGARDLARLAGGAGELPGRRLQRVQSLAALVLDHHLEIAAGADAAHRRRRDHDELRVLDRG